ncbi:MAG: bifunctional 5,10-methylene-tetrahydrofolate dehydrogenase/5,10-methylene-tetrahydrofolate cyclohydrolase, partial [Clostridium sp.]
MITLRGAEISAILKVQVEEMLKGLERIPQLAIVRVGESPDDISYEKGAVRRMRSFGLHAKKFTLPSDIG